MVKEHTQYNGKIVRRFLQGREFSTFLERYLDACNRTRAYRPSTEVQKQMFRAYKGGKLVSEVAREFKVKQFVAQSAINKVAREIACSN